jgi:hypothetical protein
MNVLPALPLIEANVIASRGATPPLTLLPGELRSATLVVRNVGALRVTALQVSLQPYNVSARAPPLLADEPATARECASALAVRSVGAAGVAWHDDALAAHLPLPAGAEARIALQLAGHETARGGALLLAYAAAADATHCRHALVPLSVRVVAGVRLVAMHVARCFADAAHALVHFEFCNAAPHAVRLRLVAAPLLVRVVVTRAIRCARRDTSRAQAVERTAADAGDNEIASTAVAELAAGEVRRLVVRVRRVRIASTELPPLRQFDPNSKTFDRALLKLTPRGTLALRRREWLQAQLRAHVECAWEQLDAHDAVIARGAVELRSTPLDADSVRWLAAPSALLRLDARTLATPSSPPGVLSTRSVLTCAVDVGAVVPVRVTWRNVSDAPLPEMRVDVRVCQVTHLCACFSCTAQRHVVCLCARAESTKWRAETRCHAQDRTGWTGASASRHMIVCAFSRLHQSRNIAVPSLAVGESFECELRIVAAVAGTYDVEATARGMPFERFAVPDAKDASFGGTDELWSAFVMHLNAT